MRILVALMVWARFADQFTVKVQTTALDLAHALCFYLFSTSMLVGFWSRTSTLVLAGVLLFGFHGREIASNNMHLLVLTVLVLALTPLGASYSVDRHLALARAERRQERVPSEVISLWSTSLLAVLLSSVYLSTFLNKTNVAFLSGERLQAILAGHYTGSDYLVGQAWSRSVQALSIAVWLLEGALVFGLLLPRLRAGLMLAGAFMHMTFYTLFRVYAFSTNMVLLYFAFVPPAQVAEVIDRLCGYSYPKAEPVPEQLPSTQLPSTQLPSMLVRWLRLGAIALVVLLVLTLGAQRLRLPNDALDARVLDVRLLQPAFEASTGERQESPHSWKRRSMQRWNEK
jgi:hypothetical protein